MRNMILLFLTVLLAVVPLAVMDEAEFLGADGEAEAKIAEISPDYEPWFQSIWEPPSGEVESLLFSLQAAAGAIVIGYVIGFGRARKKYSEKIKR